MEDDLAFAGVARTARLIAAREVSAAEARAAVLGRIERFGPAVNCFTAMPEVSERLPGGPLHGVPVVVKDNVAVAGLRTGHGTRGGRMAAVDCAAVGRLRAAGAAIVGLTTLPELAQWGHFTASPAFGVTRNPWDLRRSPGGSSGGSAAAVAAGFAAGALGSDGGCSIRVPAAFCGLVGLKPQRGRITLAPDRDHWHGLTVLGPLGRTVEDVALLFDVLRGAVPEPLPEPGRLRVAVSTRPSVPLAVAAAHRDAVAGVARALEDLGHALDARDPDYGVLGPALLPRYLAGVAGDAPRAGELERRTRRQVAAGRRLPSAVLRLALRREPATFARLNRVFADHDVLLTPVTAQPAPSAEVSAGKGAVRTWVDQAPHAAFTGPWSATGQPALSVPAGVAADGLPLAVQLVGRPGSERTLLALAAQLEAARPWADRRPAL